MSGTVLLMQDEYDELLRCQRKLRALENNGVDNWEYYDDAMSEMESNADDVN